MATLGLGVKMDFNNKGKHIMTIKQLIDPGPPENYRNIPEMHAEIMRLHGIIREIEARPAWTPTEWTEREAIMRLHGVIRELESEIEAKDKSIAELVDALKITLDWGWSPQDRPDLIIEKNEELIAKYGRTDA